MKKISLIGLSLFGLILKAQVPAQSDQNLNEQVLVKPMKKQLTKNKEIK